MPKSACEPIRSERGNKEIGRERKITVRARARQLCEHKSVCVSASVGLCLSVLLSVC